MGRGREWAGCTEAMATCSGVFLVGEAGMGKSRLASELADYLEAGGARVVRLHATRSTAGLPLGVFAAVLPAEERFLTPMFIEVRDLLLEGIGTRGLVVYIDDVDLLDDTSAMLVHQLVTARSVRVIATMRKGALPSTEVADLWRRGSVERFDLEPFDEVTTRELVGHVLGGTLDAESGRMIFQATAGNPLFIREISLASREAGLIENIEGDLVVTALPGASSRISDLVKVRFANLSLPAMTALTHIAFGEPLGPGELRSTADIDVLAALEDEQLIVATQDDRRTVLRLAHPLYGEVIRANTPYLKRRAILSRLADDLAATGSRRRGDLVRLARLHIDSGQPINPDYIGVAGPAAHQGGDLVLCERLSRALFDHTSAFQAGWDLAHCLYQQSDVVGSLRHLEAWRPTATEPGQKGIVAMMEAQTAFWLEHDAAKAKSTIAAGIACLDGVDPGSMVFDADELRAVGANFDVCVGHAQQALDTVAALLEKGPGQVLIRAALAAAHALRIVGRSEDALVVLDRATDAMGIIGQEAISLSERILVATRCACLFELGRLGETLDVIRQAQTDSIDDFGLANARLVEAMALTMQGFGPVALKVASIAHRSLLRMHADGAPRWSLSALCLAQSLTGDVAGSSKTIELIALDDHPATMFDGLVWLAKARERAGAGFPADARSILADGANLRRQEGDSAGEGHLLYELARLGDPHGSLARLAELAVCCQGELVSVRAAHVQAMVDDDALALIAASRRFAAMPSPMFAAEAASQAADAARRAGDQRAGNRYASEAMALRNQLDAAAVTSLSVDTGPVPLTRREREIALLAVQGLASKVIGQRLYISARTAETHLAKVYDKLGIRSRSELAGALDCGLALATR